MCFVYGFEYMRELVEEPPYCARMIFVIMSCNCWIDIEANEVECPCWEVPSPHFPLSILVFSPFKVKPGGCSGPRLDSPESYTSNLFIRVAILTFFSLSAFVKRMTFCSILAIFSSIVEVLVIITSMTSRYDGENDETGWVKGTSFLKFLITGDELIEKVFVGDDSLLISKSFKIYESLVVAFLFARKSR